MTAQLAEHLRSVWSYDGLQVVATSASVVKAEVGPTFPVSELCMDVCDPDTFNADVAVIHSAAGTVLQITPRRTPETAQRWGLWVWALLIAALAAAARAAAASEAALDLWSVASPEAPPAPPRS